MRAAFVGAAGDGLITVPGGTTIRLRLKPGQRVLVDRAGPGFFVVDPQRGDVQVHDGAGRPLRRFPVPGPVEAAVCVARTGGLATLSKQGMAGRFAAWGALLWGGDYRRYAAGLASDPQGDRIIACFLSFGAEVVQASSGARVGVLNVGRPVECAAASSSQIALGCSDGSVVLTDRSGRIVAEGRAASKVVGIGLSDAGQVFIRLGDGTVRLMEVESAVAEDAVAAPAPSLAIVGRRLLANASDSSPRVRIVVACDGSRFVAGDGRERATICDPDGRVSVQVSHAGALLDAWVQPSGDVLLATTREIRRVRAGEAGSAATSESVRGLSAELVRANWSADGGGLVVSDELGCVRMLDGATGADIAAASPTRGDHPDYVAGSQVAAAFQTRSGAIRCFGVGWERDLALPGKLASSAVKLVAVGRQGPVVVAATELIAFAWDGRPAWSVQLRATPSAVRVLADERLLVVVPGAVHLVERDGCVSRAIPRPEGTLSCVGGTDGGGVLLVWTDGRRVTVSDLPGVVRLEETLESPVLAAAASRSAGLVAVSLAGAIVALRVPPAAAAAVQSSIAGPSRVQAPHVQASHVRASSGAIG
ncbi:MAG: hypothetical protein K8T90_01450 [Planctomycetes bacterium]|nr:hypothetical protein [Planctomycetota bacterium]